MSANLEWVNLPTLLESIEYEIRRNRGRMTLINEIMQESPNLFSPHERAFYKKRAYWAGLHYKKARVTTRQFWSTEDVEYLLEKYGTMSIARLSEKLKRTPRATKRKFYKIAPKERIASLPVIKNGSHYGV